jgi:hypothetical protein
VSRWIVSTVVDVVREKQMPLLQFIKRGLDLVRVVKKEKLLGIKSSCYTRINIKNTLFFN